MKIRVSAILQIISGASSLMGLRAALENSRYRFESSSAQMRETFTVKRAIIMALSVLTPAKQEHFVFYSRKILLAISSSSKSISIFSRGNHSSVAN